MLYLHKKSIVITGSSMGIGKAVALELARLGANVVLNSGASADALKEAVEEIRRGGGTAVGCLGSVADFGFAGSMVRRCVDEFGGIDALINVAGIAEPTGSSILNMDPRDWHRQIDVHLHGTFNTCRHAAPLMAEQGHGSIINTCSHGLLGIYGGTGYAAAKGATLSLTWALAKDLKDNNIRVNAVCPGAESRLSSGPDYLAKINSLHERGILDDKMYQASLNPAPPRFLAPTYAYLASDLSTDVSGKLFSAAGGYVGLFSGLKEKPVAYKDHKKGELWDLQELADRLKESGML